MAVKGAQGDVLANSITDAGIKRVAGRKLLIRYLKNYAVQPVLEKVWISWVFQQFSDSKQWLCGGNSGQKEAG